MRPLVGTTFQAVLHRLTKRWGEDVAMDVIAQYLVNHTIGPAGEIPDHGMGYFWQAARHRRAILASRGNSGRLKVMYVGDEVFSRTPQGAPQHARAELRQVTGVCSPCLVEFALDESAGRSSPGLHKGQGFKFRCRRARVKLREELGL